MDEIPLVSAIITVRKRLRGREGISDSLRQDMDE
jgi:hypothetical protein